MIHGRQRQLFIVCVESSRSKPEEQKEVANYVESAIKNHDRFVKRYQGSSFFSTWGNDEKFTIKEIPYNPGTQDGEAFAETVRSSVALIKEIRDTLSEQLTYLEKSDLKGER